jgi:uncharacterized protein
MATPPLKLSVSAARRFLQLATGLDGRFQSVAAALDHLGFVQIDPINVCGRMQDHILRHRVQGYQEQQLMQELHSTSMRCGFEHHLPDSSNLAALPLSAWPHLQRTMQSRTLLECTWSGKLSAAESRLAKSLLARMADEGQLCSQDVESQQKAKTHAWDSTTLAKSTLQKLFFHGRVLIAKRQANRRYYALPEQVLPDSVLNAPLPTEAETRHWLALLKLRQRRLAVLKAAELRAISEEVMLVSLPELSTPRMQLYTLRADAGLLDSAASSGLPVSKAQLLAPLDPILYDRRVTEALWAYHYRWEVYTPPQKRVRGYYALPLLHKNQLIGHADVKADRSLGQMEIVSQVSSNASAARSAVQCLAGFLGLKCASG